MAPHQTVGIAAGLAVVAIAGCGAATTPKPTPVEGALASSPLTASVPVSATVSTAPGSGDRLIIVGGPDGGGAHAVATRITVIGRAGTTHFERIVRGSWSLPAAVPGQAEGISWDGSRVVLVAADDPGRFMALSTRDAHAAPRIASPSGHVVYDGLSVDGSTLFVTQLADARGAPSYRILRYDIKTGRLDPKPIVDKFESDEAMAGEPVARAPSADFLYTVYERTPRPFVHALESRGLFSICIDLPRERNPAAAGAWAARTIGSRAVTIWNRVQHTAYRLTGGAMEKVAYAGTVK